MDQRLLEGDVDQIQGSGLVLEIRVVGDVDPAGVAEELQDVAQIRIGELQDQQLVGGRIEQRRLRFPARLLAHGLDGGRGAGRLDACAQLLLQIGES